MSVDISTAKRMASEYLQALSREPGGVPYAILEAPSGASMQAERRKKLKTGRLTISWSIELIVQ